MPCAFCGGNGLVRRYGPDGHAGWCPAVNDSMRAAICTVAANPNASSHARRLADARRFSALRRQGLSAATVAAWAGVSISTVNASIGVARREGAL